MQGAPSCSSCLRACLDLWPPRPLHVYDIFFLLVSMWSAFWAVAEIVIVFPPVWWCVLRGTGCLYRTCRSCFPLFFASLVSPPVSKFRHSCGGWAAASALVFLLPSFSDPLAQLPCFFELLNHFVGVWARFSSAVLGKYRSTIRTGRSACSPTRYRPERR